MSGKLKRIHVNQPQIRANKKTGENHPVLTCKSYDQNQKGNTVIIKDDAGNEVARVTYQPDTPLSCGARAWIETRLDVQVL